jgi:hypothetical protein
LLPEPKVRPVAAPVASVPLKSVIASVVLLAKTNWFVPEVPVARSFGVGAFVN